MMKKFRARSNSSSSSTGESAGTGVAWFHDAAANPADGHPSCGIAVNGGTAVAMISVISVGQLGLDGSAHRSP